MDWAGSSKTPSFIWKHAFLPSPPLSPRPRLKLAQWAELAGQQSSNKNTPNKYHIALLRCEFGQANSIFQRPIYVKSVKWREQQRGWVDYICNGFSIFQVFYPSVKYYQWETGSQEVKYGLVLRPVDMGINKIDVRILRTDTFKESTK